MPWALRSPSGWRRPLHTEACFASATTTKNEESCRRYLGLAEEAGDELGAGWAQAELARIVFHVGRDQQTQELSDAAVHRLEPLGDSRELAFALNVAGWYRWRRGRYEEAEPLLRRAVADRRACGCPTGTGRGHDDSAINALGNLGQLEVAVDTITRAYDLAMEVGGAGGLGRIYNNFASIAGNADPRRAVEVLREGLEVSRKAGAWQYVAWITGSLGDFETLLGNLAEAEARQRESIELARDIGDDPLLTDVYQIALGSILAMRGRRGEAQDAFDASGLLLTDNPEPQAEVLRLDLASLISQGRGDTAAELDGLRAFADFVDENGVVVDWAPEVFIRVVRRAIELGDRALGERLREPAAHGVFAPTVAVDVHIAGLLEPDPAEQRRLLGDAVDRYGELGLKISKALGLIDLGRAEARLGRDGRSSFERARDLLIACDAQLYLPEVEEALAALGRTGASSSSGGHQRSRP